MIRGIGEGRRSSESAKTESGGFSTENMSQVPFRGGTYEAPPEKTSEQFQAEMRAREQKIAQLHADLIRQSQQTDAAYYSLNATVNEIADKVGGGSVRLETGPTQQSEPKKKKGLFGLFGRKKRG